MGYANPGSFRYDNMVDIQQQITYWQDGSNEDFEAAKELIANSKIRHGMFFAHLAVEKLLKAKVCAVTNKLAPRIHNLVRLSQIAELTVPDKIFDFLAEMNAFQLEGRYPMPSYDTMKKNEAENYLLRTGEVLEWLSQQF